MQLQTKKSISIYGLMSCSNICSENVEQHVVTPSSGPEFDVIRYLRCGLFFLEEGMLGNIKKIYGLLKHVADHASLAKFVRGHSCFEQTISMQWYIGKTRDPRIVQSFKSKGKVAQVYFKIAVQLVRGYFEYLITWKNIFHFAVRVYCKGSRMTS